MFFKPKKDIKVALVLGGGGARGLAHLGVIKVLEKAKVPFGVVVGTSAGAMFGGMFCQLGSIIAVEEKINDLLNDKIFNESGLNRVIKKREDENFFSQLSTRLKERIVINMAHSREGIVKHHRLRSVIDFLLTDQNIEDLPIPFAAVAVDLVAGKEVVFTSGSIRDAVDASSSLPGYFSPVEENGRLLVDGAVLQVVPIPTAKAMGADFVIAVNVSQDLERNSDLKNVVQIISRASSITSDRYNKSLLEKADVVLRPRVGHLHWSEFDRIQEAIALGEKVAELALPDILYKMASIGKKRIKSFRIIFD